ncbi:MAG: hypothetical protein K8S98_14245 [Planctomycetes bacterium]|nr:hypothetical protein [Planctomycetota bacterium]
MLKNVLQFTAASLLAALPSLAGGSAQNYCATSPNSVGPGAKIHWSGPVTLQQGALTVDGLPPHASGFFVYGLGQQQIPFGNGLSCFPGASWILARKAADVNGACTLDVLAEGDQDDLRFIQYGVIASQTLSVQYFYRDTAAGGAKFNSTDALLVQF